MAVPAFNVLSLCSGGGGLDLGLRLAVPAARVVCYVEREASAIALLVAHMQAGGLDDAPLWSDLRTFDSRPWRGVVDCIIGGIPCQPWSVAGKRRGADDERNLWPDTIRIIREIGPRIVFIENVGGIVRDGYERLIRPDLIEAGYKPAAGIFTAAEVGAPHRRERLFILAHAGRGSDGTHKPIRQSERGDKAVAGEGGGSMADSALRERGQRIGNSWGGCRSSDDSEPVGDAASRAIRGIAGRDVGAGAEADEEQPANHDLVDGSIAAVGDAKQSGSRQVALSTARQSPPSEFERRGRSLPAFPPGPGERARWAAILAEYPDLAPAAESPFRCLAHGLACELVLPRHDVLSILGNGCVPAQVALAWRTLSERLAR